MSAVDVALAPPSPSASESAEALCAAPSSPTCSVIAWADHQLRTRPQSAAGVVSFILTAVGEVVVQLAAGDSLDAGRMVRIAGVASCLAMFGTYYWYLLMDRAFPSEAGAHRARVIGRTTAKVVLEEAVFNPVFNTAYLTLVPLVLGQGLGAAALSWRTKFPAITLANLCVWPLANMFNYSPLVPSHLRQPIVAGQTLCWMTYLCLRMRG